MKTKKIFFLLFITTLLYISSSAICGVEEKPLTDGNAKKEISAPALKLGEPPPQPQPTNKEPVATPPSSTTTVAPGTGADVKGISPLAPTQPSPTIEQKPALEATTPSLPPPPPITPAQQASPTTAPKPSEVLPKAGVVVAQPGTVIQTTPTTPTVNVPEVTASAPKAVDAKTVVEVIIDASGSMNGTIGTRIKMDTIKQAIKENIIRMARDEGRKIEIGFRFFGHQNETSENNCSDTKLVYPVSRINILEINKALDSTKAQGTTPIALSLTEAAKDLPPAQGADNIVVLIADGTDSCGGDPCRAAQELHDGPTQATIHVIGFDLNQKAQTELTCISDKGAGNFYLARDDNELFSAVEQAFNAATPYNLRLQILNGATPLTSTLTIYEAGTGNVIRRDQTSGVKSYKLSPGFYDILVEFTGSAESEKPTKILKGIEIGPTGNIEQKINFAAGQLKLLAYDKNSKPTYTEYVLTKSGTDKIVAKLSSELNEEIFYLLPGKYDITAENVKDKALRMKINLSEVEITDGTLVEKQIRFQTGQLFIKGLNAAKAAIPITYRVTPVGKRHEVLAKGDLPKEGGIVDIAPGNYDVYVEETIPDATINPQSKTSDITITAAQVTELTANVISGTLNIRGIDTSKKEVYTEYVIKDAKTREDVAFIHSEKGYTAINLPPGDYAIVATHAHSSFTPKPVVEVPLIKIEGGKTATQDVAFKLGGLKLIGRNTKEAIIPTSFYIYHAGTEEIITEAVAQNDWIYLDLPANKYDVKAIDVSSSTSETPTTLWLRDVVIEDGKVTIKEAVYTNGKIKLIARGSNNTVIECEFNIYEYGTDGAIFSGKTSEQWQTFDIEPGRYYLEAKFLDSANHQILKKWISLIIEENQILETIIRF